MASRGLGTVSIDLEARIAKFESDMGRAARIAQKEMERMRTAVTRELRQVNDRFDAIAGAAKGAAAGLASAFSIREIGRFLKQTIDAADAAFELAQKTGISASALSQLGYAAKLSGANLESIQVGMRGLSKSINEAAKQGTEAGAVFKAIGVSIKDASGMVRPAETILSDVAEAFAQFEDGPQKAALAMQLFGKAGSELIPFLNNGRDGLAELREEAVRLGVAFSDDTAAAANELNDNLDRLRMQADAFGNSVVSAVLPALNDYVELLVKTADGQNGAATAGATFADWLKKIATGLVIAKNAVDVLIAGFEAFVSFIRETVTPAFDQFRATTNLFKEGIKGTFTLDTVAFEEAWGNWLKVTEDNGAKIVNAGSEIGRDFKAELDSAIRDVTDAFESSSGSGAEVAKALEEIAKRTKKAIPPTVDFAQGQRDVAAAVKASADAQRDLARQNERDNKAVQEHTLKLEQLEFQHAEMIQQLKDETELLGVDEQTRKDLAVVIAGEAYERELLNRRMTEGLQLSDATIANMRREYEEGLRARNIAGVNAEAAAQYQRVWTQATDAVADAFVGFIDGSIDSFEDFADELANIGKQLLAQLVRMFLNTQLTVGGGGINTAGLAGGAGGGQGMGGGSVFGAGAGSLGWAAGGAGLGYQWAGTPGAVVGGVAGLAAYGAIAGTATGAALGIGAGSAAAAAGVAAGGGVAGAAAGAAAAVPVVGWIIAALALLYIALQDTTQRITVIGDDLVGHAPYANLAPGSTYESDLGGFTFASIDLVSSDARDELASYIVDFDNALASILDPAQLEEARDALSSFRIELEDSAITVENVVGQRFSAVLGTFSSDIQAFVNDAEGLNDRVRRLAQAAAVDRIFDDLDIDMAFRPFLDLVDDMAISGEEAGETLQRVIGSMELLRGALNVTGIDLELTGEAFIRFAAEITDAAGGLQQAQALWAGFFQSFYSPDELLALAIAPAQEASASALEGLGLSSDTTMQQFRALFEQQLPTLSAEAIVEWLEAAQALAAAEQAQAAYNDTLAQVTQAQRGYADAVAEIRAQLLEINGQPMSDFVRGLAQIRREEFEQVQQLNEMARAAGMSAAAEGDLAAVHQLAAARAARAMRQLREAAQGLIQQLYGSGNAQDPASIPGGTALDSLDATATDMFGEWERALEAIRGFLDSILLNEQLTTLTPQEQLAEAQAQFNAAVAAAQGGDVGAAAALPGLAQELLENARDFFASGDAYEAIFQQVLAAMGSIGMPAGLGPAGASGGDVGGAITDAGNQAAEDIAAERLLLAQELAGYLRDLADAMGASIFGLAEELGLNLTAFVTDLGVDLTTIGVETATELAGIANLLGVELTDLANELGISLGDLRTATSAMNDAIETAIANQPPEIRDELAPLLAAVEGAVTEADATAAIAALETAVNEIGGATATALAPFLANVDPLGIDDQIALLSSLDAEAATQTGLLAEVRDWLSQIAAAVGAANTASGVPGYDTGAATIERDHLAMVHSGEKIIDAQTAAMLDRYGIRVHAPEGGDSETSRLLRDLVDAVKAGNRDGADLPNRLADALRRASSVPGNRATTTAR